MNGTKNRGRSICLSTHALIAKLDSMETSLLDVLGDLRESVDFLAAVHDDLGEAPTEHERMVIYRALEGDYFAHSIPENIKEMDAVLARFKKLAGL